MHRLGLLVSCLILHHAGAGWAAEFQSDIVPVLTKFGCNTGACHGAAIGRGELRLSLYGGDPDSDFLAFAREFEGRRINLSDPSDSLILLKATESIEHGGGQRIDVDGEAYALILSWIRSGAPSVDAPSSPTASRRLSHVSVDPSRFVASPDEAKVALHAIAHFQDGTTRDVTRWTVFTPEDPVAVAVDSVTAVATVNRPGRHVVVARYLSEVVPVEFMQPLSDQSPAETDEVSDSLIDQQIVDLLQTLRIPISGATGDATYLRRATLDLTGRLPSPRQLERYYQDPPSSRRQLLVDRLLNSDAFNDFWTLQLANLLRLHGQPNDLSGAGAYHNWIRTQLADRVGYDDIARTLLVSQGDSHAVGPANFYRSVSGPREQAELASEVFMGSRLRCANCHNHPLDRWTQDDYHGLAAIFAKVRSGKVISLNPKGSVIHPKTGEDAIARIPGEEYLDVSPTSPADPRIALADWLTDRNNPYFSQAIVNRLWKAMMGRGLVEPVDDFRATNPATHPDLLNLLAEDFVDHDFDLRHTLRRIALSDAYGRSSDALEGNQSDDRFYSRFVRKPLQPEVLADAVSDVLDVPETYGDLPDGTRAVSLVDPKTPSRSLDILGRCDREASCESGAAGAPGGLTLKLHLFNGELLNRRIIDDQGRLARLLNDHADADEIVEAFYLAAFQRHATADEQAYWARHLDGKTDRREVLEDFVWSLLTCEEFATNH